MKRVLKTLPKCFTIYVQHWRQISLFVAYSFLFVIKFGSESHSDRTKITTCYLGFLKSAHVILIYMNVLIFLLIYLAFSNQSPPSPGSTIRLTVDIKSF